METLRTFIAIELKPDIQEQLNAIQAHLKKTGADASWVKSPKIHLTLKFLGEIPSDKITSIISAIQATAECQVPFSLELTHLGAFPRIESPQVIWIGVEKGKEELKNIVFDLQERLAALGFPKEKKDFSPHATLGRLRSSENRFALIKSLKEFKIQFPLAQEVRDIALIKSTLTSQGPIYEVLGKAELVLRK